MSLAVSELNSLSFRSGYLYIASMYKYCILRIVAFLLVSHNLFCQSPYRLSLTVDVPISANAIGFLAASAMLGTTKKLPPADSILTFNPQKINLLDRNATQQNSRASAYASDACMFISATLPLLHLINTNSRKDFGKVAAMGTEAFMLNLGITNFVKELASRRRPLLYNPEVPMAKKLKKDNFKSFFSGHTSTVATMSFFFAKTYNDYNPNSKYKPLVWSTCALFPAVTGFLRYKAGKHFWTDILTGYAVGALCGLAVPYLHTAALQLPSQP